MAWYDYIPGVSMIDSMLHPERGYEEAADKIQQGWKEAKGFEMPFMTAGTNQIPILNNAENQLLNPSQLLADWMGKYQASPYAQRSFQNAESSGLDAASRMGLMGSSAAVKNIQQSSSDIMNADRQQFLNDLMQKFLAGIGVGQNIFNTGATAAGNLAQQRLGVGENLAGAAFGAQNAPGNMLKDLLAMGAKTFMNTQTGGASATV